LKERGITDPELAPGWAYFVEEKDYQAFIKDYVDEPEVCRLLIVYNSFILFVFFPRLTHVGQNTMHLYELLFAVLQAIRLLV
jgi:hypothetical protein